MIEINIVYADNTTFLAGGFATLDAANLWMAEEQTRSYWNKANTFRIVDHSAEAASAAQAQATLKAALDVKKAAIITARAKGAARTPIEVNALLDLIVDILGIT